VKRKESELIYRDAPLIVWGAIFLHIVIGVLVLTDEAAGRSTGPAEVVQWLGATGGAVAMLSASALALTSVFLRRAPNWTRLVLLLPQQLLLYVAAWGGLHAVVNGHYADGVDRPYQFILTDQLPLMLLAVIHTLAVIEFPWQGDEE
jgi:hypothetical protein